MPNRLPYGDKKFYYGIHCNRQRAMGNEPISYFTFIWRLRKGMSLHDAIYYPRVEYQVRHRELKSTVEDNVRRRQKLNEENVMILDFDEIDGIERKQNPLSNNPTHTMPNKIKMPKPKKSLRIRILELFKKD